MRKPNQYVVYKGETLVAMGSAEECAEEMGVGAAMIRNLGTPSYHKKVEKRKPYGNYLIAHKIPVDDEIVQETIKKVNASVRLNDIEKMKMVESILRYVGDE